MATQSKPKKAAVKKPAPRSQKPVPVVKSKPVAKKAAAKTASSPKPKEKPAPAPKPKASPAPVKSKAPSQSAPQPVAPQIEPPSEPAPVLPPPALVAAPAAKPHAVEIHVAPKIIPPGAPLTVSVQSSQGAAANGNSHPANLLVIVTCAGWPVTELSKDHFTLMEHFEVPGQTAPFSNNITSFRNAGTGAYLLQIRPISAAPWRVGHHLGQILISTPDDQQGQAAFKLIIR